MRLRKMWFLILIAISGISLCHSVDVGGIISGNRMGGVPLGRSLGNGQVDVEGVCQTPGLVCLNCTHAVSCVALPVGWLKVPLMQCADGETCNVHLGGCSKTPVPECDVTSQKYEHVCEQVGIFPDAYDCRKFHLCSPPADLPWGEPAMHRPALCPRHYAFDPQTAQCSINLPRGQCPSPLIPPCTELGETKVFPGSPSHYYICLFKKSALYPQIFLCPNGWTFQEGICRPYAPYYDTTTREPRNLEPIPEPTTEKVQDDGKSEYSYSGLSFFSTERTSTYAPDTFLADKFDLSGLNTEDSSVQFANYEMDDSFETGFGIVD